MTTFAEYPTVLSADGALVRAYLDGDDEAFDILFRRFYPDVVKMMALRVRDRALAEDLAQETLLRALRYLHRYDPARPFWPWLHRIADNLANAECARRGIEVPVDDVEHRVLALPDTAEQVVSHALVMECLAKLQPRHRRALVLRYVEDRDPNDIAALFGLNRNALEQLLNRARGNLLKEYRARSAAFTPGFAALAHRLRRAFAAASSRIQYAGGTTFSVGGDFALSAALTMGGIGIVTTFGGQQGAADAPLAGARPVVTAGSSAVAADARGAAAAYAASARAVSGALVGSPARGTTGGAGGITAGDPVAWAAPPGEAAPAPGAGPGEGGAGDGAGSTDAPAGGSGTTPVDSPSVRGDAPAAPATPEPEPAVDVRTGGDGAPGTSVQVTDQQTRAEVATDESEEVDGSGEVTLTRWVGQEGDIAKEEVTVNAGDRPYEVTVETTSSGDSVILCTVFGC